MRLVRSVWNVGLRECWDVRLGAASPHELPWCPCPREVTACAAPPVVTPGTGIRPRTDWTCVAWRRGLASPGGRGLASPGGRGLASPGGLAVIGDSPDLHPFAVRSGASGRNVSSTGQNGHWGLLCAHESSFPSQGSRSSDRCLWRFPPQPTPHRTSSSRSTSKAVRTTRRSRSTTAPAPMWISRRTC